MTNGFVLKAGLLFSPTQLTAQKSRVVRTKKKKVLTVLLPFGKPAPAQDKSSLVVVDFRVESC